MDVQILGCGTSSGVPRVGNDWGECDADNPKNRRRRVSILVSHGNARILVDTGPDLREQLLDARVSDVEGVIWTHDHADHCHGIDDLRQLYHARGRPVAGYARQDTLEVLQQRFAYAFDGKGGYPAVVRGKCLPDHMNLGGISVRTVDQPHGTITSAGLRFDAGGASIVYSTDFNELTPDMANMFEGIDLWVVDALRRRPHPTHPHLSQVLEWIRAIRPKRAILTHMDNSMDYDTLVAELPDGVEPAYDGQVIQL
ncbi:MBL fold metallo-hydrolase [Sphingosinicella rhizophila]|uniref:MBL fold metallo-hydrolase n=1 Tax=Sphingosinicella rhizophila TaxID=3050082 RepID=A0ABU3Q2M1_9SPHN|nr:MBL fold metallo-hydrolase [Sphingosinicella sp. GR2756]MDT9597661.1 MBL fold metallo-hydrolase [Sphingosinicella sp. GR2756]